MKDNERKQKPLREFPIQADPFGSYTGQPLTPGQLPVQDADDL